MTTGSVIVGRAEAGVIVCTPEPGMAKLIVSEPGLRVGIQDRLAKRADPAVVRVGHHERVGHNHAGGELRSVVRRGRSPWP